MYITNYKMYILIYIWQWNDDYDKNNLVNNKGINCKLNFVIKIIQRSKLRTPQITLQYFQLIHKINNSQETKAIFWFIHVSINYWLLFIKR